ncbi:MAG: type II toxin-antitoxin system VapC family toxin [Bryobacteraceae bacterium]
MIIPDVNILIHAYQSPAERHPDARAWWERTMTSPRPVGLAWVVLIGFIRITTHRGILRNPLPSAHAVQIVRGWLGSSSVQIVNPGVRHADILFRLIEEVGVAGNLTTDAHLAALAIEYQAEIASTDNDFARFQGLRWFNPVAS